MTPTCHRCCLNYLQIGYEPENRNEPAQVVNQKVEKSPVELSAPEAPRQGTLNTPVNLAALRSHFTEQDVSWRPLVYTRDRKRALIVAYVSNRAIMDRLDAVCGPENWKNIFSKGPDGGVICGISIRVFGEWVTKWDGAENTDVESVKGGLSASMRRAAVQWGIGRYLYRLPRVWVPVDEKGRPVRTPTLPPEGLQAASGDGLATPHLQPYVLVNSQSKQKAVRQNGRPRAKAS